jgi:hypothetical protein
VVIVHLAHPIEVCGPRRNACSALATIVESIDIISQRESDEREHHAVVKGPALDAGRGRLARQPLLPP